MLSSLVAECATLWLLWRLADITYDAYTDAHSLKASEQC